MSRTTSKVARPPTLSVIQRLARLVSQRSSSKQIQCLASPQALVHLDNPPSPHLADSAHLPSLSSNSRAHLEHSVNLNSPLRLDSVPLANSHRTSSSSQHPGLAPLASRINSSHNSNLLGLARLANRISKTSPLARLVRL